MCQDAAQMVQGVVQVVRALDGVAARAARLALGGGGREGRASEERL
jgi:hypothetical protein